MTFLLIASAPAHAKLLTPTRAILERHWHAGVMVYGGRPRPKWKPKDAWWIGWWARPGRSRASMLKAAVSRLLADVQPDFTIVTSARYHLEQEILRQAKPVGIYFSTLFMEATLADGQRDHGPRMRYYDVADVIFTQGQYLKDQLVSYGVDPARIHVIGSAAGDGVRHVPQSRVEGKP